MRVFSSLDLRRYLVNFPRKSGEGDKDDGRLYFIYQKKKKNQMLRARSNQSNFSLVFTSVYLKLMQLLFGFIVQFQLLLPFIACYMPVNQISCIIR